MTRTDEGYAFWKDQPKRVAAARVQAKGVIARRKLWQELVESWAAPVVNFMAGTIDRHSGKRLE